MKNKLLKEEGISFYINSVYKIFSNVDEITKYQEIVVHDLQIVTNNWNSSRNVSDFFENHSIQMRDLYANFARNFVSSALALRRAKKLSTFDQILKEVEESVGVQVANILPSILSHPLRMKDAIQVGILSQFFFSSFVFYKKTVLNQPN